MATGYVLGVDGGATKTIAVVGDQAGKVIGVGVAGPSNYQDTGLEEALLNIRGAVEAALLRASLSSKQLCGSLFGLAGADYPTDFRTLTSGLRGLWPDMPLEVINDTWVAFRSGTHADYGMVYVSGTGANYAAKSPSGRRVTGRGIGYEWGSEGGAGRLIDSVLHFAFRAADGTGPETSLKDTVLEVLGRATYDELAFDMYKAGSKLRLVDPRAYDLVPLVFEHAFMGDTVSADIIIQAGSVMGEMSGRLLKNMGMTDLPADVVLAGSTFTKPRTPLMVSAFGSACHRYAPLARLRFPEVEPACGAYLLALESVGCRADGEIRTRAIGSFEQTAPSTRSPSQTQPP